MSDDIIPKGYWRDAEGSLVPVTKIKPIDKDRHETVVQLCEQAKAQQAALVAFKLVSDQQLLDFVGRSAKEYGAQLRGMKGKGNFTLFSFDGQFKIVRQVQEHLVFDERLQHAKSLIDECIEEWSKGSKAEIKALVKNAFQVDKAGKISTGRVLGLRSIDIKDPKWLQAMQAITDSIQVASTKSYTRFYERDAAGEYIPISLDLAAL